jgi:alanine dehydrogenase
MTPQFVSEDEIKALNIESDVVRDALRRAFLQLPQGEASLVPKLGLYPSKGGLFHAMPAAIGDLVFLKWLTIGADRGSIMATLLVSDRSSGDLLAVMDANWITAIRTAGVTALFLELIGQKPGRIAMIGCGLQARTHLAALHDLGIVSELLAFSRRSESADALCAEAQTMGIGARRMERIDEVLESADVVLSMLPFSKDIQPFLDARKLREGAVAVAVDLGGGWLRSTFSAFDWIATDVRSQTSEVVERGLIPPFGPIAVDLCEMVGGAIPPPGRTLFLPPGVALADAAVGAIVLSRLNAR